MDTRVRKYIIGCEVCHRIKAPRHARHAINMPLETPSQPWEGVTIDFVADLPESTASGYTGILVIVDRLTMMAMHLPCRKDIDSPELARLFFEHVICQRGVPDNIVTDCVTQFTSRFWTRVCSHLSTDHRLSTALHPQTVWETEHQNQTIDQDLREFFHNKQYNWVELLPLAEFAYNHAIHASTRMIALWVNYHNQPVMQFKAPKQPSSLTTVIQADTFAAGLEESHHTLHRNLEEAQADQTKYAGGKEVISEVGDKI